MARSYVRVAVRDGRTVHIKRCTDCGQEKIVAPDKSTSEFYFQLVEIKSGELRPRYTAQCKLCSRERQRRLYSANQEEYRRQQRDRHRRGMKDPEWRAVKRERTRAERQRKLARMTPEELAAYKRRRADEYREWQNAKRREDPTYFTKAKIRERRAEAQRKREAERKARRSKMVRVEAEPFRRWLVEYMKVTGLSGGAELAFDLGVVPRRVTAVLGEEQTCVAFDVVDRAVSNAARPVDVALNCNPEAKTTVFAVEDLYGGVVDLDRVLAA